MGFDTEAVAQEGARRFFEAMLAAEDHFEVAFSGGSTPRRLYETLAEHREFGGSDWRFADFFQVDERCVPLEHPESNFRMLQESFLGGAPVGDSQVHRMRGDLSPPRAAAMAETEWRDFLGAGVDWPVLDFVVLGMGRDGHTASLFPRTVALEERERWVVENWVPQLDTWRITMTFPVLERVRCGVVLVTGEDKAEVLMHLMNPELELDLPIARLMRANPNLTFLLDRDAASGLDLPLADDLEDSEEHS